jgi:hypothetical protein
MITHNMSLFPNVQYSKKPYFVQTEFSVCLFIYIHLTPPNKCSLPCVQLDVNRRGHERLKDQQKSNNFLNFLLKEDWPKL